jgi:V/A-type H+-transporting ATPase subunit I
MSIAKIKKIEILGLQQEKEKLLELLHKLALVQIRDLSEDSLERAAATHQDIFNLADMSEMEEAVNFLSTFKKAPGLLCSMVKLKPAIHEKQLIEAVREFDYRVFLNKLSELRLHLKNIFLHRERLIQESHLLSPWRKLRIPLDQLHYTKNCGLILGILRTADYLKLQEYCAKERLDLSCEVLQQDKADTSLVILCLKEEFARLETLLKEHHFNFVVLPRHKGTPQERLLEINREVMVLDDQVQAAKEKITELARQQLQLMSAYDYSYCIKQRLEMENFLLRQRSTFLLTGWAKERDIVKLKKVLLGSFKDMEIFISSPESGEEIPVALENPRLIQPFEFITRIYGFPKYAEIDPTPYLAPFFFIYFGFCVSDAGYGFILSAFSWFILKKFKMGQQGQRFFRLFFFCGISTILVGALTGSWFGNLFDLLAESNAVFVPLKRFKDSLILLDPMQEPTKLLGIALSFGIVQVWFGNIVAAIGNIKNKRYWDILMDQVPMLTLLFGLTGLGLIFLKILPGDKITPFKYSALIGSLALISTQGRFEKDIGSKIFYGVYNLYNALSGYLSDILSYSRLWALGLVTGVMATTINLISVQFSQIFTSIIPFGNNLGFIKVTVSTLILVVIFVFGHLVSFLMNLLGAFVHPVRLQFVEFFSKFFKGGGSAFKPFKVETKYIDIN